MSHLIEISFRLNEEELKDDQIFCGSLKKVIVSQTENAKRMGFSSGWAYKRG